MSKLAIVGGPKSVTEPVEKFVKWPLYGKGEEEAVLRILHSGYDCYKEMEYFEEEFKDYMRVKYALSVNNGTAGLHSAFFAVGVGAGDEIITPSFAYWATCAPALCLGAVPIFADIKPETLNIDPAEIERRITPRTKAIVVLHYLGLPCEMDEIMRIAHKHNLKVIEDACHSHGAIYHDKKVGTIGDVGVFSFQASKLLPALEGGMLVTNNKEYLDRAKLLGHYGQLKNTPFEKFNDTGFGYKYRIHPLAAAIGRVQLRKLDALNKERNDNIEYFCSCISDLPALRPRVIPQNSKRTYYGFRLQYFPEELNGLDIDSFIAALLAEGASVSPERYRPQHLQPLYAEEDIFAKGHPWNIGERWNLPECYGPGRLPETERVPRRILVLSAWPRASKKLLNQQAEAFRKVIANIDQVPRSVAKLKANGNGRSALIR